MCKIKGVRGVVRVHGSVHVSDQVRAAEAGVCSSCFENSVLVRAGWLSCCLQAEP